MAMSERDRRIVRTLAEVTLPEGHGLPGAESVGVASALEERMEWWHPRTRAGVRSLLRAWEWGPLLSRFRKPFSRLSSRDRAAWLEDCYRSRLTARRLHVAALKQILFLVWASTPEVEDALGYDYRCRADDEPRGAQRSVGGETMPGMTMGEEPDDYHRSGPAVAAGVLPELRMAVRSARAPELPGLDVLTWPDVEDGQRLGADVVVVGSGAGGAVVATRLAEAGLDVIVLEEGGHVVAERDFVGQVFDRFQRFCRDDGTTQVWGVPPIPMPLGKVIGGTTVVNSGTCFRAPNHILERWGSRFGVEGASGADLDPYFAEPEAFLNVRPVPWNVLGPNGALVHKGAVALGLSGGPLLRNITDCKGCGQCAFGCPTNAKQAMHITYLPSAQQAGARVLGRCRVERIDLRRRPCAWRGGDTARRGATSGEGVSGSMPVTLSSAREPCTLPSCSTGVEYPIGRARPAATCVSIPLPASQVGSPKMS